jgi:hypothetical protein
LIVPFDPELHARFVFSAWCNGSGETFERLHRLLRTGARAAVKVGSTNRNVFMGWAVVTDPQTVAWVYTKDRLRGSGIMSRLLEHLGVDLEQPMTALFWSPACDGLIGNGWPIVYAEGAVRPLVRDERRAATGR